MICRSTKAGKCPAWAIIRANRLIGGRGLSGISAWGVKKCTRLCSVHVQVGEGRGTSLSLAWGAMLGF